MEQAKKQANVRLIGLDLDGTTLTSDKVLTPHTKEVLEKCLAEGIQVLPATGRVKSGIPEYLTQIEGMRYVILSNGASVLDLKEDKVLYQNCIPWDRALELFDVLETYNTFYDVYALGAGWCEARFYDNVGKYGIEKHIEELVRTSRNRIDDLREWMKKNKAPVEKMNMFFAKEEERQKAFRELGKIEDLSVTCSLGTNLEIHIPVESIMACGDGNNDFEMIKMAGVGVAMKNGEESLKEVADFVTKTNDEEGVAYAIEHFCDL